MLIAAYIVPDVIPADLESIVHGEGVAVIDIGEPFGGLGVGTFSVGLSNQATEADYGDYEDGGRHYIIKVEC